MFATGFVLLVHLKRLTLRTSLMKMWLGFDVLPAKCTRFFLSLLKGVLVVTVLKCPQSKKTFAAGNTTGIVCTDIQIYFFSLLKAKCPHC